MGVQVSNGGALIGSVLLRKNQVCSRIFRYTKFVFGGFVV